MSESNQWTLRLVVVFYEWILRTHIRIVGKAACLNIVITKTFLTHVDALLCEANDVRQGPPLVVAKCIDLAEFLTREAMPEDEVGSRRICVRSSE